jgi:hypothetical protein
MNVSELTALLHRSESETLDFKSKQYPFARTSAFAPIFASLRRGKSLRRDKREKENRSPSP